MKIFVVLLVCTAVGYMGTNMYLSLNTTANLTGYVFLEQNEKYVTPLNDLQVFLLEEDVQVDINGIIEQYHPPIDSLVKELQQLEIVKEQHERFKLQAETGDSGTNSAPFDYRLYRALKDRHFELLSTYNEAVGEAIRRHFYQKTNTNSQGLYSFKKIPKDHYYIYAFYGSVKETYHWFEPVQLTKDSKVHLTRKNLGSLFQ